MQTLNEQPRATACNTIRLNCVRNVRIIWMKAITTAAITEFKEKILSTEKKCGAQKMKKLTGNGFTR